MCVGETREARNLLAYGKAMEGYLHCYIGASFSLESASASPGSDQSS